MPMRVFATVSIAVYNVFSDYSPVFKAFCYYAILSLAREDRFRYRIGVLGLGKAQFLMQKFSICNVRLGGRLAIFNGTRDIW